MNSKMNLLLQFKIQKTSMTLTSTPPTLKPDDRKGVHPLPKKTGLTKNIKHTYTKNGQSMLNTKKATTATLTSFLRSAFKSFPVQLSSLHSTYDVLVVNYTPKPIQGTTLKLMNKVHLSRKMVGIVNSSGHKRSDWSNTNSSFNHMIDGKSYLLKNSVTDKPILLHLRNALSDKAMKGLQNIFCIHESAPEGRNIECKVRNLSIHNFFMLHALISLPLIYFTGLWKWSKWSHRCPSNQTRPTQSRGPKKSWDCYGKRH